MELVSQLVITNRDLSKVRLPPFFTPGSKMTVFQLPVSIHLNQTGSEHGGRVFIRNVRTQSPRDTTCRADAASICVSNGTKYVYSKKAAGLRKYYCDEMHAPVLKELRAVFT
jgi:hypothetical protein